MRTTTIRQKIVPSLITMVVVFVVSIPVFVLTDRAVIRRFVLIGVFFFYNLICLFVGDGRDLGMVIYRTYWAERYGIGQRLVYAILYSASFSTVVVWVWFPFDLLLINLLLLQLPTILVTGTTLHGLLSRRMVTVTH